MNISLAKAIILTLAVPAAAFLVALLVSWRYRAQVQKAMLATSAAAQTEPAIADPVTYPPAAPAPLQLCWISAGHDAEEPSGPRYKWIAWNHLRQRQYSVFFPFWFAATLHFLLTSIAVTSALPSLRWPYRLLYAYALAIPEIALCLIATSAILRTWVLSLLLYAALGVVMIPAVHGFSHFLRFMALVIQPAALQLLALAFILPKRMRSISTFVAAAVAFGMTQSAVLLIFFRHSGVLTSIRQGSYSFTVPIAVNILAVVGFVILIRRENLWAPVAGLFAAAGLAFGIGKLLPSLRPFTGAIVAFPFLVLGCALVWLIFRGLRLLLGRRLVTGDIFHLYLAWGFLTFFNIGFAGGTSNHAAITHALLAAAAFPLFAFALQSMLWRYSRHLQRAPIKHLLLLRVFGRDRHALGLLESLRDTWRLFGSVDLISGTDLAGWIITPEMFEAYLRGRVKNLFLKSPAEVDEALARLDRCIAIDGRYPINELRCFVNTWRYAVERLTPLADVVLMDLRGFSESHLGCVFELTQLLSLVPLERILLLADHHTDLESMQRVVREAWSQLSPAAPSRLIPDPKLAVMNLPAFNAPARKTLVSRILVAAGA